MKKLTLKDIDRVCDMAVDITGSHHPDDAERERQEIQRIRSQMKFCLRLARDVAGGRICFPPGWNDNLPV